MPDIGHLLVQLNSVDSTNNYAMAAIHEGLSRHGNVYIADEQTNGRGQRGKNWTAEPGRNITMTVVLEPEGLLYSDQFLLSATIALGCHDFFHVYARDEIKIKWPNDIYFRDRKAGGILIENVIQGNDWKYAVVGIGLNINQTNFPEGLINPVSLKQITGKTMKIEPLVKELCVTLQRRYSQLLNEGGKNIIEDYNYSLYKHRQTVKLRRQNNVVFPAKIQAVDSQGRLVTEHVIKEEFVVGEVEWVL